VTIKSLFLTLSISSLSVLFIPYTIFAQEDDGDVIIIDEIIRIRVTVEQPGVSILPSRILPEFEELNIVHKSFRNELKGRYTEIIFVDKQDVPIEKMTTSYINEVREKRREPKER